MKYAKINSNLFFTSRVKFLKNNGVFLIFFLVSSSLAGQFHFSNSGGAHFSGMGRTGLSVAGIGAMYYNQAGLAGIKNWAADVSYERRFNLEDLTSIQISGAKKFGFGTFGLMFSQFGSELYNEQQYSLAYGRQLSERITLGGMLSMFGFHFQNTGEARYTGSFSIGSSLKLDRHFMISAHIFSPVSIESSDNNQLYPRFRTGLTYSPSEKVFIYAEVEKELSREQWEFKFGLSYNVIKTLMLQTGINPNAGFYSFGIAYQVFSKCTIRGAGGVHNVLGLSPAISVSYGE
ncbi:MAG: hypothetical protein IPL63_04655 [Saprospiraceae bacterium]|nr:hypothetical protein [Saprospiraceae bacterium]